MCVCACHSGGRTDTRVDVRGGNAPADDVRAIIGTRGTVAGRIHYAYCEREQAFHVARDTSDRDALRNGRYVGRERATIRPRASASGTYVDVRDHDGNVQRTLAAIAGDAHVSNGDDAQARIAVYAARKSLQHALTGDALARYRARASRH